MLNTEHSDKNDYSDKFILTFGYGNRNNYDDFFSYLKSFQVICVVDVRLNPRAWSRKWYGEIIEEFCSTKNINYISKVSLGNTSGNSNWIPPNYQEATVALQEVSEIAKIGTILLLCAEKNSCRCHRVDIAQQLQKLVDRQIKHLE
ncbi:hypothetical protein B6N60_00227 [Richelia sinica FACHB-800]|uniref:DUF488 domain-containing protein n=1 Tax=Richelia sinica FACHB-800 TaxID=1357546 RepID=A0A975T3S0_9NOST|nr:DUF488 domain-containing protein [Richelia sinica]MBD2667127.1 DUF488 domain-containing protein [Richelia sinica FACHB-800]QXE21550.1 hypothetical protein B6N60_00227 [Richelia sinica FACHB-800]